MSRDIIDLSLKSLNVFHIRSLNYVNSNLITPTVSKSYTTPVEKSIYSGSYSFPTLISNMMSSLVLTAR